MVKTALITGATSGIGLEFAKILAKQRYNLILVARNLEQLDSLKEILEQEYSIEVETLPIDLTQKASFKELQTHIENLTNTDILINNAGFGDFGYFCERGYEKLESMIQLNINALTELTHIIVKKMLSQNEGGKILNVASIAGLQPVPYMAVYAATKAFVVSLSEALHYELKNTKISITTLLPGPTDTNFFRRGEGEK